LSNTVLRLPMVQKSYGRNCLFELRGRITNSVGHWSILINRVMGNGRYTIVCLKLCNSWIYRTLVQDNCRLFAAKLCKYSAAGHDGR